MNQEKRLEPVDMHYGDQVTDQVTYHLPAGIERGRRAAGREHSLGGPRVYIAKTQYRRRGRSPLRSTLARAFTEAKPEEYQDLRGFYQKVAAADQQELVLTATAPAAKGN